MSRSRVLVIFAALILVAVAAATLLLTNNRTDESAPVRHTEVDLPEPMINGGTAVEAALANRRSIREYRDRPLTLSQIGQLLWSAQGITRPRGGFRTAPSAGALYPLEVLVAVGSVEDLAPGVYRYHPSNHKIRMIKQGDILGTLSAAALGQDAVEDGAAVLVISAIYERTMRKYGDRGIRYVHIEVGAATENVYLQAESLGLGTVLIGAFDDAEVQTILGMEPDEQPLAIMPIGWKE